MFQKEVGKRIVAREGSKEYGRLSVMTQQRCKAYEHFVLPSSVFVPPPKVEASVVSIEPLVEAVAEGERGTHKVLLTVVHF